MAECKINLKSIPSTLSWSGARIIINENFAKLRGEVCDIIEALSLDTEFENISISGQACIADLRANTISLPNCDNGAPIVSLNGFTGVISAVMLTTKIAKIEESIHLSPQPVASPSLPGTIRWSGTDFFGFNGTDWLSLTSGSGGSGGGLWSLNGTTNDIYYNDKNVGVGVVTPLSKFHVVGTIRLDIPQSPGADTGWVLTYQADGTAQWEASSAVATYTNLTPTPSTVGGIPAGTTFNNIPLNEMWDMLLYPYQAPTVSISGGLFTTYEVGESLPSGLQTINYSVSNSSNIKTQPPFVGDPSTNVAGAVFPIDPFQLLAAGSFDVNIPASYFLSSPGSKTLTLQGTNSEDDTFQQTKQMTWRHKRYWGTHPSFSLPADAQIIAADGASVGAGNEFSTSRAQTRNGINGAGDYLFFAWPTSFGNPTFTINGLPNTAWTKVGSAVSFTNASGHAENYDVWMSDTQQFSPITLFQIT